MSKTRLSSFAPHRSRVVVAMSGGVDSSVAAKILVEQGYDVIGVTMKLWNYDEVGGNVDLSNSCCSLDSINGARMVCAELEIPHFVYDFSSEFQKMVIENFKSEYLAGRTPNPCIRCNTYLKWHALLDKITEIDADSIATGHYAQIVKKDGKFAIARATYREKDQSYALWELSQENLKRTIFPLGELTKPEVRKIAKSANLETADEPESQEICFIPDNDYYRFLRENTPDAMAEIGEGRILDENANELGTHKGFPFYTVGQRRGLGIYDATPFYVKKIDGEKNEIIVAKKDAMTFSEMKVGQLNWMIPPKSDEFSAQVKIRYRHEAVKSAVFKAKDKRQKAESKTCHCEDPPVGGDEAISNEPRQTEKIASSANWRIRNDTILVKFSTPQTAVAPGQSAVFYDGDVVLGGGIIFN